MEVFKNFNIPYKYFNSIILIGNFDGLHIGHQKLFKLAKKYKKKYKLKIGVLTFEPVPKMFFNRNLKNFRISNNNQKNFILKKIGADFVITKKFDKIFSKINYYQFIKKINDNNFYISTTAEKIEILNRLKLDKIIIIEFNENINQTSAKEFLGILTSNLKM